MGVACTPCTDILFSPILGVLSLFSAYIHLIIDGYPPRDLGEYFRMIDRWKWLTHRL